MWQTTVIVFHQLHFAEFWYEPICSTRCIKFTFISNVFSGTWVPCIALHFGPARTWRFGAQGSYQEVTLFYYWMQQCVHIVYWQQYCLLLIALWLPAYQLRPPRKLCDEVSESVYLYVSRIAEKAVDERFYTDPGIYKI